MTSNQETSNEYSYQSGLPIGSFNVEKLQKCKVEIVDGLSIPQCFERKLMMDAIEQSGTYRQAARVLRMAKSTFHDRAKAYGILIVKKGS